jgi:Flp pilus assembly protein TadB
VRHLAGLRSAVPVDEETDRRRPARPAAPGAAFGRLVGLAAAMRRRCGRPPDQALDRRLAVAIGAGVVAGTWHPVAGVVAGAATWAWCRARARSSERRQDDRRIDEVPDLVELFRLATGAGLNVHLAVAVVAARFEGLVGDDLRRVPARVARGERLADALDGLAESGDAVRPLAAALAAAERYGDPLGPVLDRLSAEARMVRRRRAEETARRLPVQLLFPLVLCVLPAFVLLAVVPLLLTAVPQLPR